MNGLERSYGATELRTYNRGGYNYNYHRASLITSTELHSIHRKKHRRKKRHRYRCADVLYDTIVFQYLCNVKETHI